MILGPVRLDRNRDQMFDLEYPGRHLVEHSGFRLPERLFQERIVSREKLDRHSLDHEVFVDNRIDGTSGAIRVRAKLPNPDRSLTPGAFARVRLETGAAKPVVLVHERAILSQLNTRYVLGVKDTGETVFRPVQLGAAVGGLRIVEKGLSPQDRIVVVGLAKVFYPGMKVAPVAASMETLEMATPPAEAPSAAAKSADATAPTTTEGTKP